MNKMEWNGIILTVLDILLDIYLYLKNNEII